MENNQSIQKLIKNTIRKAVKRPIGSIRVYNYRGNFEITQKVSEGQGHRDWKAVPKGHGMVEKLTKYYKKTEGHNQGTIYLTPSELAGIGVEHEGGSWNKNQGEDDGGDEGNVADDNQHSSNQIFTKPSKTQANLTLVSGILKGPGSAKEKMQALVEQAEVKDINKIAVLTTLQRSEVSKYFAENKITPEDQNFDVTEFKNLLPEVDVKKRWTAYRTFLDMVASGESKSLIAYGTGGIGKTYNASLAMKKAGLVEYNQDIHMFSGDAGDREDYESDADYEAAKGKDYDYVKITGKTTPAGLFATLYEHNGKIIMFDDNDSVLTNDDTINFLKGALDTSGDGTIEYRTPMKIKDANGDEVPKRFTFTGQVVFITNLDREKMPQPLRSRSLTIDLTMNADETIDSMRSIVNQMPIKNAKGDDIVVSKEDREAAVDFLDKYKHQVDLGDLNARTLGQIILLKRRLGNDKSLNWEEAALSMLN